MPLVTIVMRSKNDILYIARTFEAIKKQTFSDYEILNFDSGSDDGTWEIIQENNSDKAWQVKPEEYVPGKVLNKAIKKAEGDIIVFNNSDCIPENEDWLEKLIKPLLSTDADNISATFANQLARSDAFILVKKDNKRAFGDGSISAKWDHFFSLASSAASRQKLLDHPFREDLQYSEDIDWSWRMKDFNFEVRYVADAKVEHSHNYSLRELKKRFYNEGIAEAQIYSEGKSFWRGFVFPCMSECGRDIIYLLKCGKILALAHAVVYRITQRFFAWKGRHDYLLDKKA